MILSKNISNVYSRGNEIQRVFSYGKLVWEKLSDDYNGVVFTAEEANSTIGLAKLSTNQTLEYRTDYTNWQEMTANTVITLYNIGDRAYIRGELSADNSTRNYTHFTMNGLISASGNCNYIWSKNDLDAPLKAYCGFFLFRGANLTTAPELPATKLGNYCYYWMFRDTLISTAPELPATTLTISCYNGMFEHCLNLTTAPELPATTLTTLCYRAMFYNCFNLNTAPELPAKALNTQCYELMFYNCNKLNYIKCLATDISATKCTNRWVEQVSETGTFIKTDGVDWSVGVNGIPNGWESVNYSIYCEPFTIKAVDDSVRIKPIRLLYDGVSYNMKTITYKYSKNGSSEWIETTSDKYINLNKNETLSIISKGVHKVLIEGLSDIYGNIISLAYGDGFEAIDAWYSSVPVGVINGISNNMKYTGFFCFCDVRDASGLLLPATNLKGCENAYSSMFRGCTSLTQAPELPATTLGKICYNNMFNLCSSLTTPPVLPATTLTQSCYSGMFAGCSSLTTAPILPATKLVDNCYGYMFNGCSLINYIKCYATTKSIGISWKNALYDWLDGVSTQGKLVCKQVDGGKNPIEDYIPDTWTVEYMD